MDSEVRGALAGSCVRFLAPGSAPAQQGIWMSQVARNLIDCDDGFLIRSRYLIHDRDPLFSQAFGSILRSAGVNPVKLPSRSPNLNAYAERFVRSVKSESVAQVIPLGERHLRRVIGEYIERYHFERNHQGLGNRLITHRSEESSRSGPVECRQRLGGLLRYYERAA